MRLLPLSLLPLFPPPPPPLPSSPPPPPPGPGAEHSLPYRPRSSPRRSPTNSPLPGPSCPGVVRMMSVQTHRGPSSCLLHLFQVSSHVRGGSQGSLLTEPACRPVCLQEGGMGPRPHSRPPSRQLLRHCRGNAGLPGTQGGGAGARSSGKALGHCVWLHLGVNKSRRP